MREKVGLDRALVDKAVQDLKDVFSVLKVKRTEHGLGHVELRLEKLLVQLVALYMHGDHLVFVHQNPFLVVFQKVQSDIVGVGFDGDHAEV